MSNTNTPNPAVTAAQQLIAGQTDDYLLDVLRHSLTLGTDPSARTAQMWIISALEDRHPELTEQLDLWAESWDEPTPCTTQPEITLGWFAARRMAEMITEAGLELLPMVDLHDECDANVYVDAAVRATFGEIEDHKRWIGTCNAVSELYEQNHAHNR